MGRRRKELKSVTGIGKSELKLVNSQVLKEFPIQ